MNTRTKVALTGIVAASAILTASGCAVEESSMLVVGNELITGTCELSPSVDGPFLTRGTLDLAIRNQYIMFPVIQNQLGRSSDVVIKPAGAGGGGGTSGSGLGDVLIEGNTVILQQADVDFEIPGGIAPTFPSKLTIPTSGTVFPQGVAATGIEIISPDLGNLLAAQINQRGLVVTMLVKVQFSGVTASGTDVVSTELTYPLDVCFGCLVSHQPGTLFTDDDNSLTCDPLARPADADVVEDKSDAPCLIGQDAAVDCRLCRTVQSSQEEADRICDPP